MEFISILVPALSGVAFSGAYELLRLLQSWYSARTKLKAAEEQEFQRALASESLSVLGEYLDRSVGPFLLSEYAQNQEVRRRVDLYLARIMDYVGSTEEVTSPREPEETYTFLEEQPQNDPELALVEEKLLNGPPWDALASLRRLIEMRLRSFGEQNGIGVSSRMGAGKMLESLRMTERIPKEEFVALRYAIDVANRGVHGFEVGVEEAAHAVGLAKSALAKLGLVGGDQSLDSVLTALRHKDSLIRVAAAQALGRINNPRSIAPLLEATRDEDSVVRFAAARALGHLGGPEATDRLLEMIHTDSDSQVSKAAADALSKITTRSNR